MYQGKHGNHDRGRAPRRPRSKRTLLAALALVLVLGLAIGGTIAYLFTNTDPITNTFTPGNTTPGIEEEVKEGVKESIVIKNEGNIDAYIRVMLVGNTVALDADGNEVKDDNGNAIITGSIEVSPTLTNDWAKGQDGYYYYKKPVSGDDKTSNMLAANITVNKGENVTVLAQSIQALPTSVVTSTWSSGVSAVNSDGTLTIITG